MRWFVLAVIGGCSLAPESAPEEATHDEVVDYGPRLEDGGAAAPAAKSPASQAPATERDKNSRPMKNDEH